MDKYITDERTGIKYELVGDYYFVAGDDEPEQESKAIGVWGQRRLRYIKKHKKSLYIDLYISEKLNDYLLEIDKQATEMCEELMRRFAKPEGITEKLKAEDQMTWVQAMNSIKNRVEEIVSNDLIKN